MGSLFSSPDKNANISSNGTVPVPPPLPPSQQLEAAQAELQAIVDAPITENEMKLWTRTGKACAWSDAGEYDKRLVQLQLINYAIRILAQETWKAPDAIDFPALHEKVLGYRDVNNNEPQGEDAARYSWSILSKDTTFPSSQAGTANIFAEFEHVFSQVIGVDEKGLKKHFEAYMTKFIRTRDTLMQLLADSCMGD
jgi:hypothetical protein